MALTRIKPYELARVFLDDIDKYIKENLDSLTCRDIHDIYFGLFDALKEYRGNSAGFTGFSELLIFRFLYHMLGEFKMESLPSHTACFVKDEITIRQAIPSPLIDSIKPDILIEKNKQIVGEAEIKIYLVNGTKTIKSTVARLKKIQAKNPHEFKGLMIIFHCNPQKSNKKLHDEIKTLEQNNHWLKILILGNSKDSLKHVLKTSLL